MTSHNLEHVAESLVADGKGILAADKTVPTLIAMLAPARAGDRARYRIPFRRPTRALGDSPSQRNKPVTSYEALEDQLLLRARFRIPRSKRGMEATSIWRLASGLFATEVPKTERRHSANTPTRWSLPRQAKMIRHIAMTGTTTD